MDEGFLSFEPGTESHETWVEAWPLTEPRHVTRFMLFLQQMVEASEVDLELQAGGHYRFHVPTPPSRVLEAILRFSDSPPVEIRTSSSGLVLVHFAPAGNAGSSTETLVTPPESSDVGEATEPVAGVEHRGGRESPAAEIDVERVPGPQAKAEPKAAITEAEPLESAGTPSGSSGRLATSTHEDRIARLGQRFKSHAVGETAAEPAVEETATTPAVDETGPAVRPPDFRPAAAPAAGQGQSEVPIAQSNAAQFGANPTGSVGAEDLAEYLDNHPLLPFDPGFKLPVGEAAYLTRPVRYGYGWEPGELEEGTARGAEFPTRQAFRPWVKQLGGASALPDAALPQTDEGVVFLTNVRLLVGRNGVLDGIPLADVTGMELFGEGIVLSIRDQAGRLALLLRDPLQVGLYFARALRDVGVLAG